MKLSLIALVTLVALDHAPPLLADDIERVRPDLITPAASDGAPAPGKRVRQTNENYSGTEVYHLLYLPTDWAEGRDYPVIVEYAGNEWKNSPGTVEGSNLGYGLSGGRGVIWVCMPFVDKGKQRNATTWWGEVEATVEYCKETVGRICAEYGGDPARVFIAGFSRGAIACNYIGLHDDEIASLWRGFICHSHYDGVRPWGYPESDRDSALARLRRLGDRPQFISQEGGVGATRAYLASVFPEGDFTFQPMSFRDHTDTWVLRDIPERTVLRDWFQRALQDESPQGATGCR